MTYLSDKARNRRQYRYVILGLAMLGLISYFWPAIRSTVYPYIEPAVVSLGTSKNGLLRLPASVRTYITSHKDLAARNDALLLTIEHLENELAEKNTLLDEAGLLEASGTTKPASTLVMYPLMRDVTTIYSSLVLSKGFKDGVVEQDLVYIRGRKPVCIVIEVYDRTSLCKLLTGHGEITEGVAEASSLALTLKGDGGGTFVAEVLRGTSIVLGQRILLKSDPSMTLGTVTDVVRDDQAVAWRVYVRGAYNPVTTSVFYVTK